jgi:hypothetical protein
MTNRSWLLYSGYLDHKVRALAEGLAELKSLRARVQRAEARVVGERIAARRSRASQQRSWGLHRVPSFDATDPFNS